MESIKDRIRKLRRSLDLTQAEFAEKIGTKQSTITGYENGLRTPSGPAISSMCKAFNVSERWLIYGEGDMFSSPSEFSLDDFARAHGATALELEIMKAYFSIDEELRKKVLQEFQKNFAQDVPAADPVVDAEAEYIKKISGAAQKKASTASNTTDEDAMA